MPNKPTDLELALCLELTVKQVAAIMRLGKVKASTRRKTLDAIKAVELTIREVAKIWGFLNRGIGLYPHIRSGKLKTVNRERPTRVTVAAMLLLEERLEKSARGRKRC